MPRNSALRAMRLPNWLSMALICVRSCMPTGVPSDKFHVATLAVLDARLERRDVALQPLDVRVFSAITLSRFGERRALRAEL